MLISSATRRDHFSFRYEVLSSSIWYIVCSIWVPLGAETSYFWLPTLSLLRFLHKKGQLTLVLRDRTAAGNTRGFHEWDGNQEVLYNPISAKAPTHSLNLQRKATLFSVLHLLLVWFEKVWVFLLILGCPEPWVENRVLKAIRPEDFSTHTNRSLKLNECSLVISILYSSMNICCKESTGQSTRECCSLGLICSDTDTFQKLFYLKTLQPETKLNFLLRMGLGALP